MECLNWITKNILVIVDYILLILGITLVLQISLVLNRRSEFSDLLAEETFTLPIILLSMCFFIFLLGFFGCFSREKRNPCKLYTYSFVVMLFLVIVQVACAILLFVNKNTAMNFIKDGMRKSFDKYNSNDTYFTDSLDAIQTKLKCCGIDGPEDWKTVTHLDGKSVADGCCKTMTKDCGHDYFDHPNVTEIYKDGCYQIINRELLEPARNIPYLFFIIAVTMFLILILVCIAVKNIRYIKID